jgi:hypothetical protein
MGGMFRLSVEFLGVVPWVCGGLGRNMVRRFTPFGGKLETRRLNSSARNDHAIRLNPSFKLVTSA